MSGGVLFQEALRRLIRHGLDPVAERDVVRALEAARAAGPLDLLYDCAAEARLDRDAALARGAAIFFSYAAGNLADDVADGECGYLENPTRTGPCVQFILQNLFFEAASRAAPAALADVAALLSRAGGPQLVEVRTREWTIDLARNVAEHIAGLQYAAYLRLLWEGTSLAPRAEAVGAALGVAGHVARDVATGDPRFRTLPADDARGLVAWAREQAELLRKENLACLSPVLRSIDPILAAA